MTFAVSLLARARPVGAALLFTLLPCGACDTGDADGIDNGVCDLTVDVTATDVENDDGCAVQVHDTSACEAARTAAGLAGAWLRFSCRVGLDVDGDTVTVATDGLPTHVSNYFQDADPCHETYTGSIQNPNRIAAQEITLGVPQAPSTNEATMAGGVVGVAIDGVALFANGAAPGDDIYAEAETFDRCGAHPENSGIYHYHGEPFAITNDDSALVGVLLDGHFVYGQRDDDGSLPSLDEFGGHTGVIGDFVEPVYHYHANLQTSTNDGSAGETQVFLTTGVYRGTPGSCSGSGCPP